MSYVNKCIMFAVLSDDAHVVFAVLSDDAHLAALCVIALQFLCRMNNSSCTCLS